MSKGKAAPASMSEGASTNVAGEERQQWTPPQGYVELSGDVVGYADPEKSPVHFIPEHAVLTDSTLQPEKTSVLIIGTLVDPVMLYMGDDDIEGQAGDRIGVWGKPGMKGLRDGQGVKVWVVLTGEKDTGKPNPMKLFDTFAEKKGGRLPIEADYREKSKLARNFLEGSPLTHQNPSPSGNGAHEDAGF